MWIDYYLKFSNEEAFMESLPTSWIEQETPVIATFEMAMDIVGEIFREDTGEALPGFHVNIRLKNDTRMPETMALAQISTPEIPKQVFA